MTYAIATIVYGWNITRPSRWAKISDPFAEFRNLIRDFSDTGLFGRSGEMSTWFGVELGEFDETDNVPFAELQKLATVTPQHQNDLNAAIQKFNDHAEIPDAFKALLKTIEPTVIPEMNIGEDYPSIRFTYHEK